MLQVRGTGLRLIEGVVAEHLKDGRSVRVDFEMTILDKAQGAAITQNRQSFTLSFDLWEQRYAVTRTGAAPRSISHLAARDAEAWCLENLALPLTALGRFARDLPVLGPRRVPRPGRAAAGRRDRVAVHAAHADRGAQPPACGRGAGAIVRGRPLPDRQLRRAVACATGWSPRSWSPRCCRSAPRSGSRCRCSSAASAMPRPRSSTGCRGRSRRRCGSSTSASGDR